MQMEQIICQILFIPTAFSQHADLNVPGKCWNSNSTIVGC